MWERNVSVGRGTTVQGLEAEKQAPLRNEKKGSVARGKQARRKRVGPASMRWGCRSSQEPEHAQSQNPH